MIDVEKFVGAMKLAAMPWWESGCGDWDNGRSDKFFRMGCGTYVRPPVPLVGDDCAV